MSEIMRGRGDAEMCPHIWTRKELLHRQIPGLCRGQARTRCCAAATGPPVPPSTVLAKGFIAENIWSHAILPEARIQRGKQHWLGNKDGAGVQAHSEESRHVHAHTLPLSCTFIPRYY